MRTLLPLLAACEIATPVGAECLVVTEVVTSPTDWVYRPTDGCRFEELPLDEVPYGTDVEFRVDWVEICNPSAVHIDAAAYELAPFDPDDNPHAPHPFALPPRDLYAGDCLVVVGKAKFLGACPEVFDFDLDLELGAHLFLRSFDGACEDEVRFSRLDPGTSWARTAEGWGVALEPFPGEADL